MFNINRKSAPDGTSYIVIFNFFIRFLRDEEKVFFFTMYVIIHCIYTYKVYTYIPLISKLLLINYYIVYTE